MTLCMIYCISFVSLWSSGTWRWEEDWHLWFRGLVLRVGVEDVVVHLAGWIFGSDRSRNVEKGFKTIVLLWLDMLDGVY